MTSTLTPPLDVVIPTPDGLSLRGWHWARPNPRARLIIAHGFGEHGGCYPHVAEALGTALNVDVVSPDLRGHGRSPGRRGVVAGYDELVSDLRSALLWTRRHQPERPTYILGHSNGGLVSLKLALEGDAPLDGLVVSNPSLKLATRVPRHKVVIGGLLRRFAPTVTLGAKLNAGILTSDPDMQRHHQDDPLRHSRISAPLFFGMVEEGRLVSDRASELQTPLLLLLGGQDEVVDPQESQRVFERVGSRDKTLRLFPDMLHEPLNEVGREQVFADIIAWLEPRLSPA